MQQEKKYPIGGYAPGNYHCTCCICGNKFTGDKRAVQCEPCAVEAIKEILRPYEHPSGCEWVKARDFKFEVGISYCAKDEKSRGAGFFHKNGAFIWGDGSITHPRDQDDLCILDESPSKEGKPKNEFVEILDNALDAGKQVLDELRKQNSEKEGNKDREGEFAEWLYQNRWFSFENGKWHYTFEQGTVMGDKTYQKHYVKTTAQLYEQYLQQKG